MKRIARRLAVAFVALTFGYYLVHGLLYVPASDYEPAVAAWFGWPFGVLITAFVIAAMVFAFTGEGILEAFTGNNSPEFRTAPVGLGTVVSVAQTGTYINEQPQVRVEFEVEAADGKTFTSHAKMIVPLTELALLQPGVVLPVRYLPDKPEKVQVDMSGDAAAAQQVFDEAMVRKGFTTRANLDIAARGVRAQAVVRSLDVPGQIRDGRTRIDLGLVVTRPDGTTFETTTGKFLPPSSVGHVQVGRIIEVRYLPDNEQEVVLALPLNA